MKKLRNNKGFTLVELLAVIVVLAIVMGIASIAITNLLNNTRKTSFVRSAEVYIEGARKLISVSDVMVSAQYSLPECKSGSTPEEINIDDIETEKKPRSPYGGDFSGTVYIKAIPVGENDYSSCSYTYSIYLTDDTYAIGTANSVAGAIDEASLNESTVLPKTGA